MQHSQYHRTIECVGMSITGSFIISGGSPKSRLSGVTQDADTIILSVRQSNIGIDEVRDFQKQLSFSLGPQKIRTGIITSADKLTLEAQNALLKTLEEPPQNCAIFLLLSDESFLIPTVLSRCQIITLPKITDSLSEEEISKFKEYREILLSASLGSKLKLASEISASREIAIDWLDKFLIFSHSSNWSNLRRIFESKKRLRDNSNVRLTMENLFLNW